MKNGLKQLYFYPPGTFRGSVISYEEHLYDYHEIPSNDWPKQHTKTIRKSGTPIKNVRGNYTVKYVCHVEETLHINVQIISGPDPILDGHIVEMSLKLFHHCLLNGKFFDEKGILMLQGDFIIKAGKLERT